jgi:ribosomal protein L14E/L6E/L27E
MLISSQELQIGQFVKSRSGRDKGRVLIVTKIIDDKFVEVVDGDLRKLENPKKKKVMHLIKLGEPDEEIRERVLDVQMINDAWIRKKVADRLDQVRVRRNDSNG